ncbi:hypothetical protein PAXRUDRAFT_135758 [Paxillus rubicundulus Ve08.2h10]|uniref:Uncharacterized protein n=1 Tax=Paxillus rubicundulus Ve08.2h10 TaxID=930991 RepID=A0A0D0E1I9_9AGAM|nr:hypothetical protein PAXRUDRAFT_135758 [Paxillus rubicundulus Ve08.2h10]
MRVRVQLEAFKEKIPIEADKLNSNITEVEIKLCALTIVCTFLNPYAAEWDADRYVNAVKAGPPRSSESRKVAQLKLDKYYRPLELGHLIEPATIVDIHGQILVWYLPGILTNFRVVSQCS